MKSYLTVLRTFRENGPDTTVIVPCSTSRARPDLHGSWLTFSSAALNLSWVAILAQV